tara:strand:+ start:3541 stop:3933 length:393 start_codon:yes stop_codon:yes gene_type:complete
MTSKNIAIRVINTTVVRKVTDGNGNESWVKKLDEYTKRPIFTDNLMITLLQSDLEEHQMSSRLSAKQVSAIAKVNDKVKYVPNTVYVQTKEELRDETLFDNGDVRRPPEVMYIYKPETDPVTIDRKALFG